ncbi:MAG: immune inhibitor A, partial [Peptococcaceae bacterium]|nr:immune inhibitor A [Peptococcaceae bacterium]
MAQACPFPSKFTQPNGTVIEVYQKGDEFLHWSEDISGNLIAYERAKRGFCYGSWSKSGPASTGELISPESIALDKSSITSRTLVKGAVRVKGSDIPLDIRSKAILDRNQYMLKLDSFQSPTVSTQVTMTKAPEQKSPSPPSGSYSPLKRKLLMVHVTWKQRDKMGTLPRKMTGTEIYNLVFDPARRSVNSYYMDMYRSSGNVIEPADVDTQHRMDQALGVIEVTLDPDPNSIQQYLASSQVLRDAIVEACKSKKVDLSKYGGNNPSKTLFASELSIGFIFDVYEGSAFGISPSFWGCATWSTPEAKDTNGVKIETLFGQGAFHGNTDSARLTIGIICHELGHAGYGFPDTYDTNGVCCGHGYWSLMASGSWSRKPDERSGETPGYIDAYNLVKRNIVTPVHVSIGSNNNMTLNSHLTIGLVRNSYDDKQYFLLQNRKYDSKDNFDRGAFHSVSSSPNASNGGLLIYHIDENNMTNNPFFGQLSHPSIAIVEAHGGTQHLYADGFYNNGDINDLWGITPQTFSSDSNPSGRLYSLYMNSVPSKSLRSGVTISNISWNSSNGSTSFRVDSVAHKKTHTETSPNRPTLATSGAEILMAWSGTTNRQLNFLKSRDGINFTGKKTLSETSPNGPALTFFNGAWFVAWTGTGNKQLNILKSTDGVNWTNKVTLPDTSDSSPSLAVVNGYLYMAWRGANNRLTIMRSVNGLTWTNKVTLNDTSTTAPTITG